MCKKVLIDSIYINNSGGKVLLDYLVESIIQSKKPNDFYFLLDPRGEYTYLDKINYQLGKSSEKFRRKYYKKYKNKFRNVLCFGNVPPPIKINIPVYTYFHNVLLAKSVKGYPLKDKLLKFSKRIYIKFLSKNSDKFLVQTNLVKQSFIKNISSNVAVELYPFFSLNNINKTEYKDISFVYISNGNPHKNHITLLKAWENLFEEGLNPNLDLTVTNHYPKVIENINILKKRGVKIINHGYKDINELFKMNSYLIYPSLTESFGLGLVEAVKAELDIIASDRPFVKEVINPTLVFDPLNYKSIVKSVKQIIFNRNNLNRSKIIIENRIDDLLELLLKCQ